MGPNQYLSRLPYIYIVAQAVSFTDPKIIAFASSASSANVSDNAKTATMMEPDDRLAGDPVWELFPSAPSQAPRPRRLCSALASALIVAVCWWLNPVLSVVVASLAAAVNDNGTGDQGQPGIRTVEFPFLRTQ